jgi:hypothetical protein
MNEFYGKQNSLFELYPARLYKLGFGCELGFHGNVIEDSVLDRKLHHWIADLPAFQNNTGN